MGQTRDYDDATRAAQEERVSSRADLNPEEREAGSDDPRAQAEAILADSDARERDRDRFPMTAGERRTSEETVS
jgi:hypothetical protein